MVVFGPYRDLYYSTTRFVKNQPSRPPEPYETPVFRPSVLKRRQIPRQSSTISHRPARKNRANLPDLGAVFRAFLRNFRKRTETHRNAQQTRSAQKTHGKSTDFPQKREKTGRKLKYFGLENENSQKSPGNFQQKSAKPD